MQAIDLMALAGAEGESQALADTRRAMEVCNACRYCETFCAVFPAMTLHREFAEGDLNYLANLCHSCRACYYSCQYAPPHEFAINVPQAMAELRNETYAQYAWPAGMAGAFQRNGFVLALAMGIGVAGVLVLTLLLGRGVFAPHAVVPGGGFYSVIGYGAMVTVASVTFLFSVLALVMGVVRYWRECGRAGVWTKPTVLQALKDAATLRYLGNSGAGCNDTDGSFSNARRHCHHAMAYGFLLCFASTSVATVYHHGFGWVAPYSFWSLPVLLGTVGGIGLVAGSAGLLWLKLAGDQAPAARGLLGADAGLLMLLLMIGVTGLGLLALRATGAMGVALAIHLGFVLAFFVTMPYSKFVHGLYRMGALLRYAGERPGAS